MHKPKHYLGKLGGCVSLPVLNAERLWGSKYHMATTTIFQEELDAHLEMHVSRM
jgi:hypothetical protein